MGVCASSAKTPNKPSERVPIHPTLSTHSANSKPQQQPQEAERQSSAVQEKQQAQAPDVKLPARVFKGDKVSATGSKLMNASSCHKLAKQVQKMQLVMLAPVRLCGRVDCVGAGALIQLGACRRCPCCCKSLSQASFVSRLQAPSRSPRQASPSFW